MHNFGIFLVLARRKIKRYNGQQNYLSGSLTAAGLQTCPGGLKVQLIIKTLRQTGTTGTAVKGREYIACLLAACFPGENRLFIFKLRFMRSQVVVLGANIGGPFKERTRRRESGESCLSPKGRVMQPPGAEWNSFKYKAESVSERTTT